MMDDLLTAVLAFLSGGGLTAVVVALFGRRKERATAGKIDSESESLAAVTVKTLQGIYQDMLKDLTNRISRLEEERVEIAALKEQILALGHKPGEVE